MDLTDEDIWHLVCAPFSTTSRELATSRRLSLAQVMRVRLHYRREPWTCPVDYVPCIVCGEPITIARATAGPTPHHVWCRPGQREAIRAIQSDRRRYLPKVARDPTVPGGRKFFKWTAEEDAILIAHTPIATSRAIGRMIDRSQESVRARRTRLRLEGRID